MEILEEANQTIQSQFGELANVRKLIREDLLNKETISYERLKSALARIRQITRAPASLTQAEQIFLEIEQKKYDLDKLRHSLSGVVLNYGRLNPDEYKPAWNNRANQLHEHTLILIELAEDLLKIERDYYSDKLSDEGREN